MKKLLVVSVGLVLSLNAFSQNAVDPLVQAQKESLKTNLQKAEAAIQAKPDKASAYIDKANALLAIAVFQDSSFAFSFGNPAEAAEIELKKVMGMVDKKGNPVKEAQIANQIISTPEEGSSRSKLSTAYLNLGVFNYQNQAYDKAYDLIWKSSNLSPKDTVSAMYAGVSAQLTNNKSDEALEAYVRYAQNGGGDLSILYSIGDILSQKAAKEEDPAKKKDLEDRALAAVDAALVKHPGNKDLTGTKFNYFIQFKRDEDAKNFLKATIAQNPNDVVSIVNLGIMIERSDMGKVKDKIAAVETAERKEHDYSERIRGTQDQIDAYKDELKKKEATLKQNLAPSTRKQIQAQVDGYKRDIAEFTKTLNERKAAYESFKTETGDISKLKAEIGNYKAQYDQYREEVSVLYKKALSINPEYPDALYQLGALYFNYAQEIKQILNGMDISDYNANSKKYSEQIKSYYNQSIPYFEKYLTVQTDEAVKEILDQVKKELEKL